MTTHDPDTGERDLDTLRAIKEYRGLAGEGKDLMFGVYGDVTPRHHPVGTRSASWTERRDRASRATAISARSAG